MRGLEVVTVIAALAAAGCRIGFDDRDPAGDDAPEGCWATWRANAIQLSEPLPVDGVSSGADEGNPFLSPDGLQLYFNRGGASRDLFVASRPELGAGFDPGARVDSLNTGDDEGRLALSADGTVAIFNSERAGGSGGGSDLWTAARTGPDEFGDATQAGLGEVNTELQELDPELSSDGLALYLAPFAGGSNQHIAVARRGAIDQPFAPPVQVTELQIADGVSDPVVSPDQRVIVFSVGNSDTENDLYFATRDDAGDEFGAPRIVPGVNTAANDGDVALSADGCELWFASARAGDRDIYRATVVP